jgi:hypothetical protein
LDESNDDPVAAMVAAVDKNNAAEADAAECRAEKARYGDMMTSKLASAEAQVEQLREALAEALDPNTEWTSSTWARLLAIRDGDY